MRLLDADERVEKLTALRSMVEMSQVGADNAQTQRKIEIRLAALKDAIQFIQEAPTVSVESEEQA